MIKNQNPKNQALEALLTGDKNSKNPNDCLRFSKQQMRTICKSLSFDANRYKPAHTAKCILTYMSSKKKLERILYSEISNYIFSLDSKRRGTFATNVESLLQFAMSEEFETTSQEHKDDCRKIILKIYDHFQLALNQIENAKNIIKGSVADVQDDIRKENKGIEREYITILAIFSSIVVAFVGGVTFSGQVIAAMNTASIYRLLIVVEGLALILLNLVYMLIKTIFTINDINKEVVNVTAINWVIGVSIVFTVLAKLYSINCLPSFIPKIIVP